MLNVRLCVPRSTEPWRLTRVLSTQVLGVSERFANTREGQFLLQSFNNLHLPLPSHAPPIPLVNPTLYSITLNLTPTLSITLDVLHNTQKIIPSTLAYSLHHSLSHHTSYTKKNPFLDPRGPSQIPPASPPARPFASCRVIQRPRGRHEGHSCCRSHEYSTQTYASHLRLVFLPNWRSVKQHFLTPFSLFQASMSCFSYFLSP